MARRVVLFVLAAICFLVSLGLLLGGIVLAAVFGSDSTVDASPRALQTPTAALVTPSAEIGTGAVEVGAVRFDVTTEPGAKPVFVGVARSADVERYVGAVPVDELRDVNFTNGRFSYEVTRRGTGAPAALPPPTSQTFWVAKASGEGAQRLSWDGTDGSYEVVVMNADGSAGVDQRVGAGLYLSFMWPLALALIITGALLLLLAILFLVLGIRSRPTPRPAGYGYPPGPPPGYQPGQPQPGYQQPGYQQGPVPNGTPGQVPPPPPPAPAPQTGPQTGTTPVEPPPPSSGPAPSGSSGSSPSGSSSSSGSSPLPPPENR